MLKPLALLLAMPLLLHAGAEVYTTSFEATEPQAYEAGAEIFPGKTYRGWSILSGRATLLAGGEAGAPAAPDGQQLLLLENGYLSRVLLPSPHVFREPFTTTFLVAYSGTPEGQTLFQTYLTHWNPRGLFGGAQFGIIEESGAYRFFRSTSNGPKRLDEPFGPELQSDTFYRLETTVYPGENRFSIRAFDANGALLGEAEDGAIRGEHVVAETGYNMLRFIGSGGSSRIYIDQLRIQLSTP